MAIIIFGDLSLSRLFSLFFVEIRLIIGEEERKACLKNESVEKWVVLKMRYL